VKATQLALIETHRLTAFYGDFQALYGINLRLEEGETLAIIGANGAGKSTFLKTIAGLLPATPESVIFAGRPIGGLPAPRISRLGISLVPEGRRLFPSLSVQENLLIGAHGRGKSGYWSLESIYALFPALAARRHVPSHMLSGGEQQMAAIGRALMANPRVLLCDEISLGLAPVVIHNIYAALPRIKASGASVILVEQDIVQALQVANRVYCFQEGRMSLAGRPTELTRDQIHTAYFGA
jgi:branched-chain amino acid transport system ATP-binding protein